MKPSDSKGPYLGIVARDAEMERRLLRASDAARRVPVDALWGVLHNERPPAGMFIGANVVDAHFADQLRHAQLLGMLPPVVFCCSSGDRDEVSNIWRARLAQAQLAFSDEELPRLARTLLGRPATGSFVLDRLQRSFRIDHRVINRALARLAEESIWLERTVGALAASEGLSRTALYNVFSRAGLPSPEKVQLLFSLDAAFQVTSRAASPEQAARAGGYSGVRSLRAGLNRIGVTLRDMRQARQRDWIFDRWLASIATASEPDVTESSARA